MFKANRWFSAPTFLPVLYRELRESSHRALNYYLRVVAVILPLLFLWLSVHKLQNELDAPSIGMLLFAGLHTFLLLLIITIVPFMTADCISSEKRNGTLGLLFLTPLTARGIIIGKGCAHAFRAFTLWLSVAPVLVIPFIMGGIAWFDVVSALTMEFSAMLITLAAGMLASALFRKRNAAYGAAFTLSFVFNVGIAVLLSFVFTTQINAATGYSSSPSYLVQELIEITAFMVTGAPELIGFSQVTRGYAAQRSDGWSATLSMNPAFVSAWKSLLISGALVALILIFVALLIGAWQIQRSWRDKISRPRTKWRNLFCTPIFLKRFKGQMQHLLNKNPIAWLQQYSWRARLTKWGLCLAFIAIESLAVSLLQNTGDVLDAMMKLQVLLLVILSIMFVFVGVSSFQSEKQTGALELILIAPLRVRQIIFGRVYGLWKQFLPAFLVIGAAHFATVELFMHPWRFGYEASRGFDSRYVLTYLVVALGFLNLPIFATYFALRVKNLIAAGILTGVVLYLAPVFGVVVFVDGFALATGVDMIGSKLTSSNSSLAIGLILGNISFSVLTVFLLHHSLSRRIYSF